MRITGGLSIVGRRPSGFSRRAPYAEDMDDARVPEGWTVWNREPDGHLVLTYRPDVFDADEYPAACLPTIYLARGGRRRRPGPPRDGSTDSWEVSLYLEPAVEVRDAGGTYGGRDEALEAMETTARRFADGEIDVRASYQVPRERYLDRLEALTGRDA